MSCAKKLEPNYKLFAGLGKKQGMEVFKSNDYVKLLNCAGLIGKGFNTKPPNRVDYVYTRSCVSGPGGKTGNKTMSLDQLAYAVKGIAHETGMSEEEVTEKLVNAKPAFDATKAGATRFHDDKSNFTGAHKYGGKHGEAENLTVEQIRANRAMQLLDGADLVAAQTKAKQVVDTFTAHAGVDCKMSKNEFKDCLRKLKPEVSESTIEHCKDYAFASFDENNDGFFSLEEFKKGYNQLMDILNIMGNSGVQPDKWDLVKNKYLTFTEVTPGVDRELEMDSARFMKLCIDVFPAVFPKKGQAGRTKADLIFAKMLSERREKTPGVNKITFAEFKTLGLVGIVEEMVKAGVEGASLQKAIAMMVTSEPSVDATAAEAVRFYDDKSSYTGMYEDIHGVEKVQTKPSGPGW